ncbi:hypothetical protein [Beijerinckia sp. L45]|uniref:hypothetical protein n=1 Tax=Beijerinckia sp. L45 TaxID=1641855 RepID=UPI00131B39DE|nr:hypothetical protein [Beijerinckia sp. L45]
MVEPRIILFIAWGDSHVALVAQCIAESRLPPYPVFLITDTTTQTDMLPPGVAVLRRDFAFSSKERKAEAFASLPETFGTVLFLDVDTRVLADISLGFDKAEQYGIAMAPAPHYSLADFRSFGRVLEREGLAPQGHVIYNSGVIFFDWRVAKVRSVFQQALALASKDETRTWSDQPYITLAMEMMDLNPYTLSPSFNHRAFGELISGSVRIWHSYQPVPPEAAQLEPGYLHRYEGTTAVRVMKVPL